jgi:TRAP-type C4-dicarboxylate transport system permease small subunit
MRRLRSLFVSFVAVLTLVFILVSPSLADSPDLSKVENFAQNIIQVLVTLAGLLAAGFFVMGGINYITSSGNPEHLDRAKKTIIYSGIGLAVCIAAFVLSNIVSQLATTAFGK